MRGRLWSWWLPAERWSRCPSKRWAISRRGNSGGSWPSRCHTFSLPGFHSKDQKISILEEILMDKMARNWGVTIKDWCVIIKYWNVTIKNCGLSITNRGWTYHCEMSVKCWLNPRSVPCWITPTLLYELRSRKQRAEQVFFKWSFALLNPPCWMVLGLCGYAQCFKAKLIPHYLCQLLWVVPPMLVIVYLCLCFVCLLI